jgi:methylated-DNA-[protein]-cysteine S-methyltransferase
MNQILVDSPIGTLRLVSSEGALVGLYMNGDLEAGALTEANPVLLQAKEELEQYFAGQRKGFTVKTCSSGTDFQRLVWSELQKIPYGTTISYGELAVRIGNHKAMRAVGLANGRNPISIIVPCHRVIGADGSLTGFGGGIPRKRFLLDLERGETGLFGA